MEKKLKQDAGTKPEVTPSQDVKRKPIETVRIGDVSGSVWAREAMSQGQPKTFYSASWERSYRTKDGGYGYTKSFDPDSFGTLIAVIEKTDEFIQGLLKEQDAQ